MKVAPTNGGSSSEDDATLFSLATEFLEAAKVLDSVNPKRVGYDVVIRYLLGHSAELLLKSYLVRQGIVSIEKLSKRPFGHNLAHLLDAAIAGGLSCESKSIRSLSGAYTGKVLEYRPRIEMTFSSRVVLIAEIEQLERSVAMGIRWC